MAETGQLLVVRSPTFSPSGALSIPQHLKKMYGKGLAFPLRLKGSKWAVSEEHVRIKSAIYLILTTPLGVRFRRPDFGSMVPYMVHQLINEVFISELRMHTETALVKWEPRVIFQDLVVDTAERSNHIVSLTISYAIKGIGAIDTLAIPIDLNSPSGFAKPGTFTLAGKKVFA